MMKPALLFTLFSLSVLTLLSSCFLPQGKPAPDFVQLERPLGIMELSNGNLLLTDGGGYDGNLSGSKIMIINKKKKVIWSYSNDLKFAHGAILLQNGEFMVPDSADNRMVQIETNGSLAWSTEYWGKGKDTLPDGSQLNFPNSVYDLPDGSLLVSDEYNNRVFLADRDDIVYWTFKNVNRPHAAKPISNDRFLIADTGNNRVIEINSKGEILWRYEQGLHLPADASRLSNGNTLIADTGNNRVIIVSPDGKLIREIKAGFSSPYAAILLKNGNIAVCDSDHARVVELNKNNKVVWQFRNITREPSTNTLTANSNWIQGDLLSRGTGSWEMDEKTFYSGKASLSITGDSKIPGPRWWSQVIQVKPGTVLNLSAYIKTSKVQNNAGLAILFMDKNHGQQRIVWGTPVQRGTKDWSAAFVNTKVPQGAATAEMRFYLSGGGKVWFDQTALKTGY